MIFSWDELVKKSYSIHTNEKINDEEVNIMKTDTNTITKISIDENDN